MYGNYEHGTCNVQARDARILATQLVIVWKLDFN